MEWRQQAGRPCCFEGFRCGWKSVHAHVLPSMRGKQTGTARCAGKLTELRAWKAKQLCMLAGSSSLLGLPTTLPTSLSIFPSLLHHPLQASP